MTSETRPDRETLLMMLSAFIDGELAPEDEAIVHEALAHDDTLVAELEALSPGGMRDIAMMRSDESEAMTAHILAAVSPGAAPESVAGTISLVQLAMDDALDADGLLELQGRLDRPDAGAWMPTALGLVASAEAVAAGGRAVLEVPAVAAELAARAAELEVQRAATERLGILASAASDGELTDGEAEEIDALLGRGSRAAHASHEPLHGGKRRNTVDLAEHLDSVQHVKHIGEALRAAAHAPQAAYLGARAGQAAMHALAAEAHAAAQAQPPVVERRKSPPSIIARLVAALDTVRMPLALAGATTALFFMLSGPSDSPKQSAPDAVARAETEKALFEALALRLPPETQEPMEDLPLLADNTAVVEALDATASTMVFATENSNITIIWVADTEDTEQGT